MTTFQRLARKRLDQRLVGLELGQRPPLGWIRAIREALAMTTSELGQRMGITQSRISQIERAEAAGSIRLETLERAARALNCQLHYVFVPNEPLQDMVRRQARLWAEAEVNAVTHTMALEDQAPDLDDVKVQVEELTERLSNERRLWSKPKSQIRP